MTLEEKREIIRRNKDPSVTALNGLLDKIYSMTDPFLNSKGNIMTAKFENYRAGKFLVDIRNDTEKYEAVRQKIILNDFSLSLKEINYIAIALTYSKMVMERQKETINKTAEVISDIINNLQS